MVELEPTTGDPTRLRQAYASFPSGVIALCALDDKVPLGMVASSFTCVSLDPGLVSLCAQNSSATWPRLRRARRLGISVLAEHQVAVCQTLSRKNGDRFADVTWSAASAGAVFVADAAAWLECSVQEEIPAGDHVIVLLAVHSLKLESNRQPLIFHGSRFRQLTAA